jgi:hypothetical protein
MTAKQRAARAKFKAVVAEAKKLRKKNPKLTQAQAVKQAWAISYSKQKAGKKLGETHKDTKSHNVNIRVVSGWKKGKTHIIEKNENKIPNKKNVRVIRASKNSITRKPGTFRNFSTLAGLFDTSVIQDIDQLKKQYFQLAKKYHPDAGGTTAQFQNLQAEYEKLLNNLLKGSNLSQEQKDNEIVIDKAIRDVIDALINIQDINIELIGKWLWISGNTYPVRQSLKNAGLIFIKKEGKPYWVYKGVESAGRGKTAMEEIKRKYGVFEIKPPTTKKIGAIPKVNKVKLKTSLKRLTKALNKRPI